MYSKLPQLVFGFHGCDQSVFYKVIKQGGELDLSTNDHGWLRSGIYFRENGVERAWEWARASRQANAPAPIYPGSMIREKTHVQICVCNPNCIKGYFEPRFADGGYQLP